MQCSTLFGVVLRLVAAFVLLGGELAHAQLIREPSALREPSPLREPSSRDVDNSKVLPAGDESESDTDEEADAPIAPIKKPSGRFSEGLFGKPAIGGAKGTIAGGLGMSTSEPYELSAEFEVAKGTRRGRLIVTMVLADNAKTYSLTQPKPQIPTVITLEPDSAESAKIVGPFVADQEFENHEETIGKKVARTQEHHGTVRWTAPIEFAEGFDPANGMLNVHHSGQVCTESCMDVEKTLEAFFAGEYEPSVDETIGTTANEGLDKFEGDKVEITGRIEGESFEPGKIVQLVIELKPAKGYHTYAMRSPANEDANHTILGFMDLGGLKPQTGTADKPVIVTTKKLKTSAVTTHAHEGAVVWTLPLTIPVDAKQGEVIVAGVLGHQVCTEKNCLAPAGAAFTATIPIGQAEGITMPLRWSGAEFYEARTAFKKMPVVFLAPGEPSNANALTGMPILGVLPPIVQFCLLGLIGGFILNFMPCVLPVIGIKILSFAEQAGKSRWKVTQYNLAYTLGLLSVFWVLAALASIPGLLFEDKLIWGEQFGIPAYRITMLALVFAMALSFLGVWEIPLPGFIGHGKAAELQTQDGLLGAFFKGIFTTLLATPCSGPFLGTVFGYASSQAPIVVFALFTSIGLGMALPYLVIGWFPSLMKLMPKPGAWMDTFKQLMGFVLLGVVVWLFSTIDDATKTPLLAFLVGIWFACWLIGQVPVWESFGQQAKAWAAGIAAATFVGWMALGNGWNAVQTALGNAPAPRPSVAKTDDKVDHADHLYEWVPYSEEALAKARAEGKTVMVDFTADWCNNCQLNFYSVLNTQATKELVERNGIVPMLADFTDRPPAIKKKLLEFRQASIPFLLIYPANGGEPIALADLITQKGLEEKLAQAGPSKDVGQARTPAKTTPRETTWVPYSEDALSQYRRQGKTVLVDFTADWCLRCKTTVDPLLASQAVQNRLYDSDVVAMKADFTNRDPSIRRLMQELRPQGLPIVAVFPAGVGEPVLVADTFFQDDVFAALDRAGPSLSSDDTRTYDRPNSLWQLYSDEALAEARSQGKAALVSFTADWDLVSATIRKEVLSSPRVERLIETHDVVALDADFTSQSPVVKAKLRELGQSTIPLVLVYPADGSEPIVLPDLVRVDQILTALDQAVGNPMP